MKTIIFSLLISISLFAETVIIDGEEYKCFGIKKNKAKKMLHTHKKDVEKANKEEQKKAERAIKYYKRQKSRYSVGKPKESGIFEEAGCTGIIKDAKEIPLNTFS